MAANESTKNQNNNRLSGTMVGKGSLVERTKEDRTLLTSALTGARPSSNERNNNLNTRPSSIPRMSRINVNEAKEQAEIQTS